MKMSSSKSEDWFRTETARYTFWGVFLGACFPVGATISDLLMRGMAPTPTNILIGQASQPLHWIIDTLPLFLGFFARLAGKRQDLLSQLKADAEKQKILALEAASDVVIWDWDVLTGKFSVTHLFKEQLGYADHEVLQTFLSFESIVHPDDLDRVGQAVRAHLGRQVPYHEQFRIRAKNGEYHWVDARGQARWNAQGQPIKMTGTVRDITERKWMEESLRDSAKVLATSTSQIMTSLQQLVASTSETASAVTQTATTVEEVKQTAYVSSRKAREVSGNAQQTAQVSQVGENSVEAALHGLHRIREQMESIAQSVLKLGEQSQTIGEIIATVNDLAEQSNLLAVNAAIEAAKAGEQGKGFAVVAQEVKALAAQSKQATAQVRTILNDIQKASNVAILVTEQGTKSVEVGVKQSLEAGESIRALSKSITEAARAVTQIAASSQQQLGGMDQVAVAMENIKRASTQNVAGMKQIEGAAQNLDQLGKALKTLVDQYTDMGANGIHTATPSSKK